MKKRSFFLVVICFALVAAGCSKSAGTKLYLIPEGYVGWVHIIYDQSKQPEIKKDEGTSIFPIGKDGILKVSNKDAVYGTSINKYFYVDAKGNKVREIDYLEEIHNQNVGNAQIGEGNQVVKTLPTVESFFVGDKSLMKNDEDVYPEDEMEQTK
ncbi:hypothetical protein QPK24_14760 [Paenibacillus polygoni]|uniref:DUF6843 domain-containing protein n=1 Tax=Paenibacillus polygoni TaxID=3050112 RepID=A0ABY8X376_9BACL|nr:hypothetical protein [Paenibacillus polygoni]WIV17680.1 hypothetical protein QPK24_14760 [Paenibacillus polygoni]